MNPVKALQDHGQAMWLDFLSRGFIAKGGLKKLVDDDGLRGVTSNPSIQSDDSCGRVPPIRSSPSVPRTTDGRSGNDCKMRGRGSGKRCASCAVIRLPSVSIAAPDDVSTDATTVVDSVA